MWPASTASLPTSLSAHKKLVGTALLWLLIFTAQSATAQNYSVLYNFTGGNDGANPSAGVTLDRGGNLYGTTQYGGSRLCQSFGYVGCGTTFKLSNRGANWLFASLHNFTGTPDGANPRARIVFGPGGALFGTTDQGGALGAGSVFQLRPPTNVCPTVSCPWTETQIYNGFDGQYGGGYPGGGDLIFDAQGNIYGTTAGGGGFLCDDGQCGTVYSLSASNGGWILNYLETSFGGVNCCPHSGLVTDNSGALYGTNVGIWGGIYDIRNGFGGQLSYFTEYLNSFPVGGLILDNSGHAYGTTSSGGSAMGGTVFKFDLHSPAPTTIYNFEGTGANYEGPTATLLMDSAGNLYGTTQLDGAHRQGSVFKLSQSGGIWTLTTLHDFTGGSDGGQPFGQLTMDANGNIYGTAQVGGSSVGSCYQQLGCGVVFEITP